MAREKAIDQITLENKKELDDKLIDYNFSHYQEITAWLNGLGYEISKSSLHRYGKKLEKELENKLSDDEEVLIFHYRKLTIEQRHILLDQLSFGAYQPINKE